MSSVKSEIISLRLVLKTCLDKINASIENVLKNGLLIDIAAEFHTVGLISQSTKDDPGCNKIIRELKSRMNFLRTKEELEKHCLEVVTVLESKGGPLVDAAKVLEESWIEKANEMGIIFTIRKSSIQETIHSAPIQQHISKPLKMSHDVNAALRQQNREEKKKFFFMVGSEMYQCSNEPKLLQLYDKAKKDDFPYEEGSQESTDTKMASSWGISQADFQQEQISDVFYMSRSDLSYDSPSIRRCTDIHSALHEVECPPPPAAPEHSTAELDGLETEQMVQLTTASLSEGQHTRASSSSTIIPDGTVDSPLMDSETNIPHPLSQKPEVPKSNSPKSLPNDNWENNESRGADRKRSSTSSQGRRNSSASAGSNPPNFTYSQSYSRDSRLNSQDISVVQEHESEMNEPKEMVAGSSTSKPLTMTSESDRIYDRLSQLESYWKGQQSLLREEVQQKELKMVALKIELSMEIALRENQMREKDERIQEIKKEKDELIQEIKKEKDERIHELKKENDERIHELKKENDERIQEIKKEKDERIHELKKEKDERIQEMKKEKDEHMKKEKHAWLLKGVLFHVIILVLLALLFRLFF